MSSTETELAGNYATSGGSGDAGFVAEKLSEMQDEAADEYVENADHDDVRHHVEETDAESVGYGTLDLAGESVPVERPIREELGVGHIARLQTMSGDLDDGQAKSFVAFLEALDAITPEEYDEDWWFDRTDPELGRAFAQVVEQSRGGNGQ